MSTTENASNAAIGIFGGTFDPVHIGHLRLAVEVSEALSLDEVRLVPSQIPPHRATPALTPEQRLALLELGSAPCPLLSIDRRELERSGPSYTVDTLVSLRADHPRTPLCLILGMDAFLGLPSWHRWLELTDYAHIVVADRPGSRFPEHGELAEWLASRRTDDADALRHAVSGRVYLQSVTQLDISATQIRALLAQGRSAQFLLPEGVWQAIRDQGLYGYGRNRP